MENEVRTELGNEMIGALPDLGRGSVDSPKLSKDISHQTLSHPACDRVVAMLESYGTNPDEDHKEALLGTMKAMTDMAQGKLKGRYAVPLPTGFGKTQSIIAWVSQLYQSGVTDKSVAVCASKVEELCTIKREMIKGGVPEEHIGLFHSYRYDQEKEKAYLNGTQDLPLGYASLPSTEKHQEKQILLVTHNRVRGKSDIDQFNLFLGQPRDLMIWDESLFIADTRGIRKVDIESALGWLKPRLTNGSTAKVAVEYLEGCLQKLDKEMTAQQRDKKAAEMLRMPELSVDRIQVYKESLGTNCNVDHLKDLLDISQSELRVYSSGGSNSGVITYEIKVPEELENIIVLDASYDIRKLPKAHVVHVNESRHAQQTHPYIDRTKAMVNYKNVTIHHLKHGSGRKLVTDIQSKPKKEDRLVSQEVAEVVKDIPDDEAVLIFTFKNRHSSKRTHIETLQLDLQGRGIDTEAAVQLDNGRKAPRFVFLTWGQETALSQYSYCSNVIFAGVLNRSYLDLSASTAGERDNLTEELNSEDLTETRDSEVAHSLYQAMSRGSSRQLTDRVARRANIYLILQNPNAIELIKTLMPDAQWKTWEPKYLTHKETKAEYIGKAIKAFLKTYPGLKIAIRKLKKEVGLEHINSKTFGRALTEVLDYTLDWEKERQSVARVTAEASGFSPE